MLRLKLKEPYDQVFVRLCLENPSTGVRNIVDAKIDTGAMVTTVPMYMLDGLGLALLEEDHELTMADGTPLHSAVFVCNVSFSDEDECEVAIHAVSSTSPIALIGMDILKQCNYSQCHEINDKEHSINFEIELVQLPD